MLSPKENHLLEKLSHDKYFQILDFLECALNPSDNFRQQILSSLKQVFGYERTTFLTFNSNGSLNSPVSINIDDYYKNHYENYYHEKDTFNPVTDPSRSKPSSLRKNVYTITDLMTYKEYEMTEYYNDFFREQNIYYEVEVLLFDKERLTGFISILKSRDEKDFTPLEISILNKLSPLLSRLLAYDLLLEQQQEENKCFNKELQTIGSSHLTKREIEIIDLIIKGFSNKEIADKLFISLYTVKVHVKSIFEKLDVKNRTSIAYKFNLLRQ